MRQAPGQRHVDPVIVVWRKIEGGKAAAGKALGQVGIVQELGQVIGHTLGLKYASVGNIAKRAKLAVDRAGQRRRVTGGRACVGGQRTGEKRVERGIGQRVGLGGLLHIDGRVRLQKTANQRVFESGPA